MLVKLDTTVSAVLTQEGADLLRELYKPIPQYRPKESYSAGDTYTTQLWELMSIFGHAMYPGGPHCFENNRITIFED